MLPSDRQLPVEVHGVQTDWDAAEAKVPTAHARPAVVMVVGEAKLCETLTVYVPTPPLIPDTKAVTIVPADTAALASTINDDMNMLPAVTADTVSVVPVMVPVN